MRPCSVCLLLALALALSLHHGAVVIVVDAALEDTCKAAAASSPNIKYDFCVAALKSVPGSGSADNKGLAIIATNLTVANATSAEAKIKGLLEGKPEARAKACLETCLELYSDDFIPALEESLGEIRSGKYADARTHLSAAIGSPDTCEETFEEQGVPSPLAKEDADARQLSIIALAITNMLS